MNNEKPSGTHADLAKSGQQRRSSEGERAVEEEFEAEPREASGKEEINGEIVRSSRSKELIHAADTLVKASESELKEAGLGSIVGAAYSYQWSGMLPSPETFNKYDEETRERICLWNDAFTVDESARQDRLVDNEIKQQNRGVVFSFALMAFFGAATLITFLVTREIASFGFLSIPLLNVIGNLFKPAMSKSSRGNTETDSTNK